MRRTAALILGGGPAGSAAAITLASAGAPHLLIERARDTPDALCGGFLSWRSLATLQQLGIEAEALSPTPVRRVRLFAGSRFAEAALPAPGVAVSRRRLDALLLARAEAAGAAIERGVVVKSVDHGRARTGDGAVFEPDAIFLATGKHDLRGVARPSAARGADPTLGLRVRLPATPALQRLVDDAVELHLFKGGYAGLALQEDGSANLCMAVHRSAVDAAGSPLDFLAALARDGALAERMAGCDLPLLFDAVANVPYGWRAKTGEPGLFRLGDQAGVIPSLAGEGMSIALASGVRAARAYLARGPGAAPPWQRGFAGELRRPLAVAGWVRRWAEGAGRRSLVQLARTPGLIQVMAAITRIGH